jgi:hypothetical protein
MPSNVRPADFSPENMAACHAIAEAGGAAASSWADLRARLDLANNELSATQAQNARLKDIAVHLHWMARRYADGRQSYATSLHNENTRALLKMGVQLNATGDGTLWARDSGGRAYDDLTDEEAAQGREPDWKHDDKERRIEQQTLLLKQMAEALQRVSNADIDGMFMEAVEEALDTYTAMVEK